MLCAADARLCRRDAESRPTTGVAVSIDVTSDLFRVTNVQQNGQIRKTTHPMTYKSTFQDRAAQAAEAKKKALEQLQSRPPVDEKTAAERKAAGQEREAAKAEKAAAKKAERESARDAAAADIAAKAAAAAPKSEAELKAARDARYAKRKARR